MNDWIKRAIEVVVILLGVLWEIYAVVKKPIEQDIQNLETEIHAKK